MIEYKIYACGKFLETDKKLTVYNPFDGTPAGITFLASVNDLEDAINCGLAAEKEMAELPSWKKYRALMFIAGEIREKRQDIARLLALESAKPLRYALGEVDRAIQTCVVAAEESKRLPREYIDLEWTPSGEKREGLVKHFPVGLVAGISPFNFPLNLAMHKIAPAIAAGCPIILKPSSSTPLSLLSLADTFHRSGLPEGAVSLMPMDRKTGNLLVTDPRFSLLSFTGSPAVGWKMKQEAGRKKVTLELGGNAGVIITPSADIDRAVPRCVTGGFSYSGQVCIHAQRFYIENSVFKKFTEKFITQIRMLKTGNPLDPETDISSMIDVENARRVEEWVDEAIHNGARMLLGGRRNGAFLEPTVLTQTREEMKVCSREIFGPVVTIEPYFDFDEALNRVNGGNYGLQAAVFTNDMRETDKAFHRLRVGGVIINDVPTFRMDHMPYGGIKESGFGREGIKYSILDMTEPRILVKNF
ncbi:MAG: aldehyde dehydrogenase family protein [Bacteroidales bacterium]|nr:aldehyde dehydrogenase family protein [Bacteroidales bacterium]